MSASRDLIACPLQSFRALFGEGRFRCDQSCCQAVR
jgi:hypothetical protein